MALSSQSIEESIQAALRHQEAGRLAEAESLYQNVIAQVPDHAVAWHQLGVLAYQSGKLSEAIDCLQKAVRARPGWSEAFSNLGSFLCEAGRIDEAIVALTTSIRLNPNFAGAHANLGNALRGIGQPEKAIVEYQKALSLQPDLAIVHSNLSAAFLSIGNADDAVAAAKKAIEQQPNLAEAHCNLGGALANIGQYESAISACKKALELKPNFAVAYSNLASAYFGLRLPDEMLSACLSAIRLHPKDSIAHANLSVAYKEKGLLDDAIRAASTAITIDPNFQIAHSNLLYSLYFHPEFSARTILRTHERWSTQYMHVNPAHHLSTGSQDPNRRLKIGYVSPDFRGHSIARFLLPLFANHDHRNFEIHAYSDVRRPDATTAQLQSFCDFWHETAALSHESLASKIQSDNIDILVDLTMHMSGSRLLTFAAKPAAVQVTWLAYAGTTGLKSIDYRISDPWLDPLGSDQFYSEQTIRVQSYWCFQPLPFSPPISALPLSTHKFITFGSLNNFAKINSITLALWAELLRSIDHSRLILHSPQGDHRATVLNIFAKSGVDRWRISFVELLPTHQYLELYQQIDIALDTQPYSGGTTTCDALWMGVPVVTLAGSSAVGRSGVSLLQNLGLPQFIANTPSEYLDIATALARDSEALTNFRNSIHARMLASPLCDAKRFTSDMELAFRTMWDLHIASL